MSPLGPTKDPLLSTLPSGTQTTHITFQPEIDAPNLPPPFSPQNPPGRVKKTLPVQNGALVGRQPSHPFFFFFFFPPHRSPSETKEKRGTYMAIVDVWSRHGTGSPHPQTRQSSRPPGHDSHGGRSAEG